MRRLSDHWRQIGLILSLSKDEAVLDIACGSPPPLAPSPNPA